MFFRDIYRPIPPVYNLVLALLWRHPENIELDKVKVVHYCAAVSICTTFCPVFILMNQSCFILKFNLVIFFQGSKPWRYTGKEENMEREDIKTLVDKWWEIYNDESLDYKNNIGNTKEVSATEELNLQPFLAALSEAGVVHYITHPSAA